MASGYITEAYWTHCKNRNKGISEPTSPNLQYSSVHSSKHGQFQFYEFSTAARVLSTDCTTSVEKKKFKPTARFHDIKKGTYDVI